MFADKTQKLNQFLDMMPTLFEPAITGITMFLLPNFMPSNEIIYGLCQILYRTQENECNQMKDSKYVYYKRAS